MNTDRKTRWFIEPRNASTNEALMEHLASIGEAGADMTFVDMVDSKGVHHSVIEVLKYRTVNLLERNKRTFSFDFVVWCHQHGHEHPQEWKFGGKKGVRNSRKVYALRKLLQSQHKKRHAA